MSCSSTQPVAVEVTLGRLEIESDQNSLAVREIADDLLDGSRQATNQRRDGDDLITTRQLRIAQQVDDLDSVPATHVGLADLFEIAEGRNGVGGISGDVQPQFPLCWVGLRGCLLVRLRAMSISR